MGSLLIEAWSVNNWCISLYYWPIRFILFCLYLQFSFLCRRLMCFLAIYLTLSFFTRCVHFSLGFFSRLSIFLGRWTVCSRCWLYHRWMHGIRCESAIPGLIRTIEIALYHTSSNALVLICKALEVQVGLISWSIDVLRDITFFTHESCSHFVVFKVEIAIVYV